MTDDTSPTLTPLGSDVVNRVPAWALRFDLLLLAGLPRETALILAVHGYQPVSVKALDRVREIERLAAS